MGRYAVATVLLILLVLQAPLFSLFPCPDCRRIAFEKPTPTPSPPPSRPSPPSPHPSPKPHPPSPSPAPAPSPPKKCPINALKLGMCVDILDGLVHVGIGKKAKEACCPVIKWLMGMDAAVCLCMAIRLKLMDVDLLLPITLQMLADCGKRLPSSYKCPCIGEDCS
ncbi:36.4 kDa proline-rich protein-like [Ananas comosus]|uniref:36.4 kDa proline-rich protein-like n=1 Tax=Ananas comosus TaxID=4615 RepID=A0A6P5GAV8_ANACO|nr:36.4 kDa proline-rich protein-like [Ananas comosus]